MKRLSFLIVFLWISTFLWSQNNLQIFDADFDSALIQAKIQNKNIFFITKSLSCPNYDIFEKNINKDAETIDFLNEEFIIFIYDMDHSTKEQDKRLKSYYSSWRGFPQLYIVNVQEKVMSSLDYSNYLAHKSQLEVWKDYKNIETNWKLLKKRSKRDGFTYDQLIEYIQYRELIYSSFRDIQMNKRVAWYLNGINTEDRFERKNWLLFKQFVHLNHLGSDEDLFDFVAQNKIAFQKINGQEEVAEYLINDYYLNVKYKKEKKVNKMAQQYPYNTIEEAKEALRLYHLSKQTQAVFSE